MVCPHEGFYLAVHFHCGITIFLSTKKIYNNTTNVKLPVNIYK